MESNTQTLNADEVKERARESIYRGRETMNRTAEEVSSRVPSLLFMFAALASIAVSLGLQLRGNRQASLFVGQWVPSFLLFGLFNKLTKSLGPD
jgi:hypothetical protein